MAIEIRCPTCNRTLRVSDEHAGKPLRCPACQQVSTAPAAGTTAADAAAVHEPATWHMRTPDGQMFGPVTWRSVEQWVAEGRIAADCQLASSVSGPWRSAVEAFPALQPLVAGPVIQQAPATHEWAARDPAEGSYSGSAAQLVPVGTSVAGIAGPQGQRFVRAHRGGLILILGVLGIAINCPIFCFMAWVMGSSDLAEMRAGQMDSEGESLTQAGRILGMVMSLIWMFAGVAIVLALLFAAVAGR
jgi:hypothetical protein